MESNSKRKYGYRTKSYFLMTSLIVYLSFAQCQAKNVSRRIRAVTILEPPFVMRDKSTGRLSGLLLDVLNEAGIQIDHTDIPISDVYGWEDQNGVTGVLGDLAQKKYDLAIAPFSIQSKRAKHVAFTQPILHAGYMVLYKTPKEWKPVNVADINTLAKPFSPLLWMLLLLVCLTASFALLLIRHFSPYEDMIAAASISKGDMRNQRMTWGTGFLYMMGTMLGQSYNAAPRSTSGRILTAVWWVFSLMTVAAYTASLVVIIFKSNPSYRELPFSSVTEMIKQTDVKVLGVKNSATFNYIKNHMGYWEQKVYSMWKHNWDTLMVDSMETALKMLEEGNGKYAVFMDELTADYLASSEPCNKMVIGDPVGDQVYGFACPKGSSLCEELNHIILKLREEGKMEKLRDKYFWQGCHMSSELFYEGHPYLNLAGANEPFKMEPTAINLERFGVAFILMLVGIGVALVVLGLEIMYDRRGGNFRHLTNGRSHAGDMQFISNHENNIVTSSSTDIDRNGM